MAGTLDLAQTRDPLMFNNYIFKVDLAAPASPAFFPDTQPCTISPPPDDLSELVLRMSNPLAEGLNNANRVENDVAAATAVLCSCPILI
ncbi:hypothetical protein PG996_000003 [Apiospora saccharicola]|uniref:Uncharacterized protein n=1 Tax=Apiospora saccharicola TaxID=335842 RepID=A0ABR1WCR2_9PEZI